MFDNFFQNNTEHEKKNLKNYLAIRKIYNCILSQVIQAYSTTSKACDMT